MRTPSGSTVALRAIVAVAVLVGCSGRDAHAQGTPPSGWATLESTQWKSDADSGLSLEVLGTTRLPRGSAIRAILRFGDEIVGNGNLSFSATSETISGTLTGMSRALPPGEYWLSMESHMSDQPRELTAAWSGVAGLAPKIECRFAIRLGTAEDEAEANKREVQAWHEWFGHADPVLASLRSPLADGKLPDTGTLRESVSELGKTVPALYAASYVHGARESAHQWMRKLEQLLVTCESAGAPGDAAPKGAVRSLPTLERMYGDLKQLAGGGGGMVRRAGGVYSHEALAFQLTCTVAGWAWVDRKEESRLVALENSSAAWKECTLEVFARRGGSAQDLTAWLESALQQVEDAKTVSTEPTAAAPTVQATCGRQFVWKKNQSGYGWIRGYLSGDDRMVLLLARAPNKRWAEFQPIVSGVMKSLNYGTLAK